MSAAMDEDIQRWTEWLKATLVLDLIQGKRTVAGVARQTGDDGRATLETIMPGWATY